MLNSYCFLFSISSLSDIELDVYQGHSRPSSSCPLQAAVLAGIWGTDMEWLQYFVVTRCDKEQILWQVSELASLMPTLLFCFLNFRPCSEKWAV